MAAGSDPKVIETDRAAVGNRDDGLAEDRRAPRAPAGAALTTSRFTPYYVNARSKRAFAAWKPSSTPS